LHRYLDDRRVRWLGLFGLGYLLQSLANGYMVFYGAVLIGLWLLYFGSTRASWRAIPPILGAWGVAALPLVPILAKYRAIHNEYDMHRVLDQPLGYSAPANAWAQVSQVVWFWHHLLPDSDHNLFPGAVALVLVCAAFVAWLRPRGPAPASAVARRRKLRFVFLLIGGVALAAAAYTFVVGPWHIALGIRQLRMTNTGRSLIVATACIAGLIWLSRRARDAINRRSLWLFYVAAAIVMAIFSSGPVLSVGYRAVLDPAPYSWLMALPGFNELRVPTRFWMLGVMCLGVGAGLSFARLVPASSNRRTLTTLVVSAAVLVESWMVSIPMAAAPTVWPVVEPASVGRPILELPIGPYFDTAAAFRSIAHRRPVFNGASGYEPQHYLPLQEGLTNHDPTMLPAIATLGSFDVVVNSEDDSGGTWTRYVLSTPGVEQIATAGGRTSYRVPAAPLRPPLGAMIPIVRVEALDTDPAGMDPLAMIDGRVDTEWRTIPQKPGHSVVADLGAVRNVGGVSQGLGGAARDFPRGLAIDVSTDGARWEEVWAGSPVGEAFRAAVEAPLEATIEFTFPPRPARFVRLRLTASHPNFWRIVELHVHAPSGAITPSRGARTTGVTNPVDHAFDFVPGCCQCSGG